MKIDIVTPALPPVVDGIGDYTAILARCLAKTAQVRILTATDDSYDAIPGVEVESIFSPNAIRSYWAIVDSVARNPPDWLLFQYNPFSYGRWGWNPQLPGVLAAVRRRTPGVRIAIMGHETFVEVSTWQFAVMTTWQRYQFWRIGQAADALFFAMEVSAKRFRQWFPGRVIGHLPVYSNIPVDPISREDARHRLNIAADTVVLGYFGTAHVSRILDRVRVAAETVTTEGRQPLVLYIGPHGEQMRRALGAIPLRDAGVVGPGEVSRLLRSVDIYMAPFKDGVSSRRGSLMAGLQHGLPTVGTFGCNTDSVFFKENGRALLLADSRSPAEFGDLTRRLVLSDDLRVLTGAGAEKLYEQLFSAEKVSQSMLDFMPQIG